MEHPASFLEDDEGNIRVPDDTADGGLTDAQTREAAERIMQEEQLAKLELVLEAQQAGQESLSVERTESIEWAEHLITIVEDRAENYPRLSQSDAEQAALRDLGIDPSEYERALAIRYAEKERASRAAAQKALDDVRAVVDEISQSTDSESDRQLLLARRRARQKQDS